MVERKSAAARWVAAAFCGCATIGAGCQPKVLPSSVVATDAGDSSAAAADGADGQSAGDATIPADASDSSAVGTDKEPMVALPAGSYYRGASAGQVQAGLSSESELPQHMVQIGGFSLDKHEVTVAQYQACMAGGGCTAATSNSANLGCNLDAPGRTNHPINCVTWTQANSYCLWAGKRLPTDAEWEYAARGLDNSAEPRFYPWGSAAPNCSLAVYQDEAGNGCGQKATWPVCSKTAGNSPQGLCDLAGNVWEYTSDWSYAFIPGIQSNPVGPKSGTFKLIRGGSRAVPAEGMRASLRGDIEIDKSFGDIGFRCAL